MLRRSACIGIICLLFFSPLSAQTKQDSEVTVEQAYLSSIEDVVIKELAGAEDRDNKLVALQYIENALNSGRKSNDIQEALSNLAGEGLFNPVRADGRIANNFPDIRAKACELLGKMGTSEAKDALIKVVLADNEPMVITAAIRSMAEIGINDNDEVVSTIAWTARKFDIINPTSSLALEVLNAYEKLAPTVKNPAEMIQSIARIASNYSYVTPVRNRAYEVLKIVSKK